MTVSGSLIPERDIDQMTTMIRQRMSRRAVALLAIFALLLTGSGLSSLAVLTDTLNGANTINITTIDLQANGLQSVSSTLAMEPGQYSGVYYDLSNAGSGSLTATLSASSSTVPGSDLATGISIYVSDSGPTDCALGAANPNINRWGAGTNASTTMSGLVAAMSGKTIPLNAAQHKDLCLTYVLGAGTYTTLSGIHNFTLSATRP